MPIIPINIPAILSLFRVVRDPTLCLPHATVLTFGDLPIPLSRAFRPPQHNNAQATREQVRPQTQEQKQHQEQEPDIRAIVLDKDNCFAVPHTDTIFPAYSVRSSAYLPHHLSQSPFYSVIKCHQSNQSINWSNATISFPVPPFPLHSQLIIHPTLSHPPTTPILPHLLPPISAMSHSHFGPSKGKIQIPTIHL